MALGIALTWRNFEANYLAPPKPARVLLLDNPQMDLLVRDAEVGGLCIRIACEPQTIPKSIPDVMSAQFVRASGNSYLEVGVGSSLNRPFFNLALAIRDLLDLGGTKPVDAVIVALRENKALQGNSTTLSETAITGLFGELWLLQQLLSAGDGLGIKAWTGWRKEAHDFRYREVEVEVKTTAASSRIHTVHGATQLVPSQGAVLFLLSIQVRRTGPGAGSSVPEVINSICEQVDAEARGLFLDRLKDFGYHQHQAEQYDQRFSLANPPLLLTVDEGFPAITAVGLSEQLGSSAAARIRSLEYSVDVSGLAGTPFGSAEFLQQLKLPSQTR